MSIPNYIYQCLAMFTCFCVCSCTVSVCSAMKQRIRQGLIKCQPMIFCLIRGFSAPFTVKDEAATEAEHTNLYRSEPPFAFLLQLFFIPLSGTPHVKSPVTRVKLGSTYCSEDPVQWLCAHFHWSTENLLHSTGGVTPSMMLKHDSCLSQPSLAVLHVLCMNSRRNRTF